MLSGVLSLLVREGTEKHCDKGRRKIQSGSVETREMPTAVGLPNLIPYMFYFWKKDMENNYLGINKSGYGEFYARQNFQRFIYAVNQPCVRDRI